MRSRVRSIQARVLLLVLGASGLLWVAAAAFTWVQARHELDELLDAHLAQSAAILVAQQLPEFDDEHSVDAPVLHRYAARVAFQVFHEGRLAVRSTTAPAEALLDPAQVRPGRFYSVRIGNAPWRVFAARGAQRDVVVLVGEQAGARDHLLLAILRTTLGPLLAGVPLLGLVLWWAVRRGLKPLNALGRTLAQRDAQDLTPLPVEEAPHEMRPMIAALDQLLGRIAGLVESERRFIADASHELRTPLAAIRAQAQVALTETDRERRQHALQAAMAGCDRASRLADQLLALSRLEATQPPPLVPVDLALVVRDVLGEAAGAAVARGQRLQLDAPQRCPVQGDAGLLAILARNLVDNAIRYAPPGARIECAVRRDGAQVVLELEDSGAGVEPAQMARLGERFFRVLGTGASGSGLGLSIVQRIAQLHGAQVAWSASQRLGGLAVRIRWPAH